MAEEQEILEDKEMLVIQEIMVLVALVEQEVTQEILVA
jgi:hypothetical protein